MTYLKTFIGITYLNAKDGPAGWSRPLLEYYICIRHLTKNVISFSLVLLSPGVNCPALFSKPLWETLGIGEESRPATKRFFITYTTKIPLTK